MAPKNQRHGQRGQPLKASQESSPAEVEPAAVESVSTVTTAVESVTTELVTTGSSEFSWERVDAMAEKILSQLIDQRHGNYSQESTVAMAFQYAIDFEKQRIAVRSNLES